MSFQASEPVRAVTFDMGGTLVRVHPSVGSVYAAVCAEEGVDLDERSCNLEFERQWAVRASERPRGSDRFLGLPGGEDGWWGSLVHDVLSNCGVEPSRIPHVSAFRKAFREPGSWRLLPGAREVLEELESAGVPMAVISNWDSSLPGLISSLGIGRYFKAVVVSALEGCEKPAPRIFRKALEELGSEPGQVLHVGDRIPEDYQGAVNAGMQARWIDWDGSRELAGEMAVLDSRGHRINALTDLRGIVGGNGGSGA